MIRSLDKLSAPWLRRLATSVAALVLMAGASVAQDAAPQAVAKRWGMHPPASTYGHLFDSLFLIITALIGVSFVIVLIMLLVPVIRDRDRKFGDGSGKASHRASFDHGASLHDKRFTAIVSIIVFLVLDASVLYITMKDLRTGFWNIPAPDHPKVVKVQVLGQQWAWNFRTPGVDGEFGTADDIITINELTLPVDRPAQFNLTSKDVIHSLFVPDMRMKRDANPGAINEAWFQPKTTGAFDILCTELCGFAHYQMYAKIHVLEENDWDAWQVEASTMAKAAYDESDLEAQWAWEWQE